MSQQFESCVRKIGVFSNVLCQGGMCQIQKTQTGGNHTKAG